MAREYSFPKHKIKILLLEKVHAAGAERLREAGYSVEEIPKALSDADLLEKISDVHVLGIRSRTRLTEEHIRQAHRLLTVGCFGVGTNQVALEAAARHGVPVFNAPYSSTRSVAELTVAGVFMLARQIGDKNTSMHQGVWDKSSIGAHEIRSKIIGLVGYGHIGQQVGLLAESCGLKVLFYDKTKKLPLGNAHPTESIQDLLGQADFVSLHVPAFPKGQYLIGAEELAMMKRGSVLINTSRGSLVDLSALKKALEEQLVAGAALDVFPEEPKTGNAEFKCELAGLPNVVLTPHIGGSTEEAQLNVSLEVADAFIKFIDTGATSGSVNFPQVDLPVMHGSHRILNIHRNVPGVLTDVNKIVSAVGANIDSQYLSTYKDIGYLIMDINRELSEEVKEQIAALPSNIKTRILY